MALMDDLIAAVDHDDPAKVTKMNDAITKINVTRAAIAAANAEVGDEAAIKAHLAGEVTTALSPISVTRTPKTVASVHGPAAVPRLG